VAGLDELRDASGRFRVLAIDHRDSLRQFLTRGSSSDGGSGRVVSDAEITSMKIELVGAVSPLATGVMLEPEYSIPQVIEAGALAPGVGFFAALESQGYLDNPGAGPTTVLEGWSVAAAAASGASCAKVLLPFHPDHPLAVEQERVAAVLLAECREVGIPLVMEPLFFGLASPEDRLRVVLETAERFAALGPDLLKLPFPVDPVEVVDRSVWLDACRQVTEWCSMPWALLSGGGNFDLFLEQVRVSTEGGCAGFMVGRALWGEWALANGVDERERVLAETVLPRWELLALSVYG
jgi:tagatose-1,6-bisphosphate aldolase